MYNLVKKILFKYDPEEVHYKVMKWLTKAYNVGIGKKYLESKRTGGIYRYRRDMSSGWGGSFPDIPYTGIQVYPISGTTISHDFMSKRI